MSGIRIITENALGIFADTVYRNRDRAFRIWLITPWLALGEGRLDPIAMLVEALHGNRARINIITRCPTEAWHSEAIRILSANVPVTLFYCRNLHAKLYILECNGFRYALLGSPNFTGKAMSQNREIGVEIRTTMENATSSAAVLMSELTQYAQTLIREDDVLLQDPI